MKKFYKDHFTMLAILFCGTIVFVSLWIGYSEPDNTPPVYFINDSIK